MILLNLKNQHNTSNVKESDNGVNFGRLLKFGYENIKELLKEAFLKEEENQIILKIMELCKSDEGVTPTLFNLTIQKELYFKAVGTSKHIIRTIPSQKTKRKQIRFSEILEILKNFDLFPRVISKNSLQYLVMSLAVYNSKVIKQDSKESNSQFTHLFICVNQGLLDENFLAYLVIGIAIGIDYHSLNVSDYDKVAYLLQIFEEKLSK